MINRKAINGQEVIILETGNSSLSVVTSLGGTVFSLTINNQQILISDKEDELTRNNLFRGRLLFPFNDRIPKGKYCFKGQELQFPLNCDGKDSIHGLIYNRVMDEIEIREETGKITLILETTISGNEFMGYPFNICLNVEYILTNKDFSLNFIISNPGNFEAPYALGWHPYFTFGKKINSASLKFSSSEYYDVDENLYYKGHHYSVENTEFDFTNGQEIGNKELDIAISLRNKSEFVLEDRGKVIKMEFSKELFPVLQLFIPDDRESMAVEPITAPSDTFNYPDTGLKIIRPGEEHRGGLILSVI